MKNGMYVARYPIDVSTVSKTGETNIEIDNLKIFFLVVENYIHILRMESKLDRTEVNLPHDQMANLMRTLKKEVLKA